MAIKNIKTIVGDNIRYFRKKRRLTIEELAFLSNVNRNYLNDIELGRKNPSIEVIERIALAFNIKPYELLKERTNLDITKIK